MSTFLPEDELTALRAVQAAALPDTAAIRRVTRTSDGAGGFTSAETTIATVACRLASPSSATERALAERLGQAETLTLTLPYGTDVVLADRVLVNGTTWDIVALLEHSWSTATRVMVSRVRTE